ncbi:GNAT family N-acetyltransferase [Qipengyuania flava]|uniref:GNAT family N-acetyltransferase n=1 Tax=Qipengyuania flava TaxID=192812 RepID=UPI001CD80521|nr:GNAT family N-acetyltransferase [Qipengyuania flava]MCA0891267.1 GNAT family N-acetyltransferase [Qipengyuania flava]
MSPTLSIDVRIADHALHEKDLEAVIGLAGVDAGDELITVGPRKLIQRDHVFLAHERGIPVGCVMATRESSPIIHSLLVVEERRGEAIAAHILEHAVGHLANLAEVEHLWAATDPKWPSAAERFLSLGFQEHPAAIGGLDLYRLTVRAAETR